MNKLLEKNKIVNIQKTKSSDFDYMLYKKELSSSINNKENTFFNSSSFDNKS